MCNFILQRQHKSHIFNCECYSCTDLVSSSATSNIFIEPLSSEIYVALESVAWSWWHCQARRWIWALVKKKWGKGNNSFNFFIAFQMDANWLCIWPAMLYIVFGFTLCPLRIVVAQLCRPQSFGLLHSTKQTTEFPSMRNTDWLQISTLWTNGMRPCGLQLDAQWHFHHRHIQSTQATCLHSGRCWFCLHHCLLKTLFLMALHCRDLQVTLN